ncbi:hypothetical protein FACS1894123_09930 [Bacteroidia bacterium]|nr:hypothetical protein FACS1894123_09930 [Bacteroidia bacterium]
MKTPFITIMVCFFVFTASAQTNVASFPNDSLWNKVTEFEEESLPQSALAVVNQIYENSLKKENSSELIKSLIYQLKHETAIDRDNFQKKLEEMEKYTLEDKNIVEQAILYSILAQLYQDYYLTNSNAINQRTALPFAANEKKPDIKEWSANLFFQTIIDYVALSLAPAEMLQRTDISVYEAILSESSSYGNLQSTLYEFLANSGIDILKNLSGNFQLQNHFSQTKSLGNYQINFAPVETFVKQTIQANAYDVTPQILKIYINLLTFRLSKSSQTQALVITDLERLDFVLDNSRTDEAETAYLDALQHLEKQYEKSPYCVEILYKKANFYQSGNNSDPENIQLSYQICKQGIKKYPDYERIGVLQNLLNQITQPNMHANGQNAVYPGEDLKLEISYRNISKIKIEIYKINAPTTAYSNKWLRNDLYKTCGKLLTTLEVDLKNEIPYIFSDTTLKIPVKELGNYEWVIYPDTDAKKILNQQFSVSRLATATRKVNSVVEYLVVDRQSGKPVKNAKIDVYKNVPTEKNTSEKNLEKVKTLHTDASGIAKQDVNVTEMVHFYIASLGADSALVASGIARPTFFSSEDNNNDADSVLNLFTDRSIYRPGQTVYFKGIARSTERVIPKKPYMVSFYDANNKVISWETFTTNEFGSLSGSFVIPQGLLSGHFSIRTDKGNGHASFSVEEYKRPTFDLQFAKNEDAYAMGDSIVVKGSVETYSGVNLQSNDIQYRILRENNSFFRRGNQSVQVTTGTVQTDESGKFSITFFAEKIVEDKNKLIFPRIPFYTIEVKLTDSKGETHTFEKRMTVGKESLFVHIESSSIIDKDHIQPIQIHVENRDGVSLDNTQNTLEIYNLIPKDKSKLNLETEDWNLGKKAYEGAFQSNKKTDMPFLKNLPSGQYRILAKAIDKKGRKTETQLDFTLSSIKDKCPPMPVYEWLMAPQTTCEVGETARIVFGSSTKVYVLYDIFANNEKVSSSRFELNNENKEIEIPFLASYGDGITLCFTFVKDGKFFKKDLNILKKQADKGLTVKTEVFRDKLTPGGKEEWKLSVKDADNNPVVSELLAAMYDASLDRLAEHSWYFNPSRNIRLPIPYVSPGTEFSTPQKQYAALKIEYALYPPIRKYNLNWYGFKVYNATLRSVKAGGLSAKAKEVSFAMQRINTEEFEGIQATSIDDALPGRISGLDIVSSGEAGSAMDEADAEIPVQIRQNFDETAFFYPQLKTNEKGETLISFTVPESNTTWKFMALAHTQDLKFGQFDAKAISQKKLMVAPNVPRFLRTGDKATISATVSNLSESAISGTVSIEFFDPNTEQANIIVAENTQNFNLEPGKTNSFSWTFDIPNGIDLTALKIVAQSTGFSDGEQHLIPVLPNRMLVTESLPFDMADGKTQTFSFDKWMRNISPTLENKGMTLEFTGNPIWNAVQALPSIKEPQSDDALSWFAAYYSNVQAVKIANSSPKIKQMIDIWTKQAGEKETLHSNLEKNQELKSTLLEETPWVMEAKNETEQKQQLANLFDVNRTDYLNNRAIEKLKSLQTTEGGWSWFKGLRSNVSITQWILYGLGEIKEWQKSEEIKRMTEKAVNYIDDAFNQRFENLKKYNLQWKEIERISVYELEYLLVRSRYKDIPLSEETASAMQFYIALAEKYWNRNADIYSRAIAATVLQRNGNPKAAGAIIKSLREHATHKTDMGMFWANNRTSAFNFQSATCIHTFIMEAFLEFGSNTKEMDEMKRWLLKQKQTQEWENVPATVNAINILLKTGSNWLENNGKSIIQWSGETLSSTDETGYLKVYKDVKTLEKLGKNTVTITRENPTPAWGALYRQYFEDLDKIKTNQTGLGVEKLLYIEKTTATGKSLVAISENTPLKTGDKAIVRLVVKTDRDMEFVHLKDMRASCFEPDNQLSGIRWVQNVIYYQTTKDASVNFYFENLPKGTYVFEYPLYVTSKGEYSNGISTIQCLYAPEFVSHTSGGRVVVK